MFACLTHALISLRGFFPRLFLMGLTLLVVSGHLRAADENSSAGVVTLAWDASTAANLDGYKVHYGQSSRTYSASVDVGKQTTYAVSGLQEGAAYYFAVTAYDSARITESGYSNEVSATIPVKAEELTADFTTNQTRGDAPLSVDFKPTVTGTVTSWQWDFGDGTTNEGTTNTVPTAMKSYASEGTYTVTLTVTGPGGTVTETKPNLVTVTAPPPVANFTASATSGMAPLPVKFVDTSTGSIKSWSWNFGDGRTSTDQNPEHRYSAAGTYTVTLTVTGAGGSSTKTSAEYIRVSASTTGGGNSGGGLVAAYGFEENSGATVADASGHGNHGTIREAVRTTSRRFGKALKFDGLNDLVTINDSASLDLSTGMTLQAWVYPTGWMDGWRTVMMKEQSEQAGQQVYALYANGDSNQPATAIWINGERIAFGVTQLPPYQWTHLAATFDGQYQRLYINGVTVAMQPQLGNIATSTGALRIGGTDLGDEYFQGYIDEVRIYDRALTDAELANDAATAISSSNPPQFVIGDKAIEPGLDYSPQGVAKAFLTTAQATKVVTNIQVYLDARSTATELVAGIYADSNGHPGILVAQGKLTRPKPGTWNSVSLSATPVTTGQSYWIAILGSRGTLRFRDKAGFKAGLLEGSMETSARSWLKDLPSNWATGNASSNGPVSAYGAGY